MTGYVGRFAPSPTGPLHAGSLLAAFGSWLDARVHGGEWLIRIEDLDPPREQRGMAAFQLQQLDAFGLRSDRPVVRQSERSALYLDALRQLERSGASFACSCSRTDLAASGGIHTHCVRPVDPAQHAIRLRVDDAEHCFDDRCRGRWCQPLREQVGDFVLRRNDGLFAYQLAVVVDDAAQGITDVVRGGDLLDSTPRQRLLQQRLGLPAPRYLHLPLLLDGDGRKLSKSAGAAAVDAAHPLPALRDAWRRLGQPIDALDGCGDVDDLLRTAAAAFDPQRIPRTSVRVRTDAL